MNEFVQALLHLDPLAMLQTGGYIGLAILVFSESGILLGIFFPGDSLLFIAGILSATGYLSVWMVISIVAISAILGDSVGYWFGARVGRGLFENTNARFFKPEYLHRTEMFYQKYGGRAIVLARFVPIVRTIAPILAGTGTMPYHAFLSYNIIGALLWGGGVTTLGYFLGVIIPNSEHYILPISLGIITVSFIPIIINFVRTKRS